MQIFLSTDNIEIKHLFEREYPGTVTAPKWYPRPGSRAHENKRSPDRIENGVEALVDLYVLAECDYLIVDTSSTFSQLAQLLTKALPKNVVDVKAREKVTGSEKRAGEAVPGAAR